MVQFMVVWTENPCVAGSIPALATSKHKLSTQLTQPLISLAGSGGI